MKSNEMLLVLLILLLFKSESKSQHLTPFQNDFKILYESFRDDHPLRHYHIDSISLLHKFDSINNLINSNTSREKFLNYCSDLTKFMNCKHTYVYDEYSQKEVEEPESIYFTKFNNHAALLRLNDFDGGKSVIKKFFKQVMKENIDTILIDLRDNPGGNGNIGNLLLSYVIDKEYKHYLTCNISKSKHEELYERRAGFLISNQYEIIGNKKRYYFTVKPKKKNHFNGKIFLLINRNTLSTATYVSSYLKHICNASVIGEETGENEYVLGGGVIRRLSLPSSGFKVNIPLYAWQYGSLEQPSYTGVQATEKELPVILRTLIQ